MELEQKPPNKPNFLGVVLASGAALLVIFVLALLFMHFDGKHLKFGGSHTKPSSTMLIAPASTTQSA